MTMFKKNGGFTLVELIVVIAILAILAGVAIPAYSGYITKAQDAAVVTELDAIATSAQAANAQAGEIKDIKVSTDGKKITVTVDTAAGDKFAKDYDADFILFFDKVQDDSSNTTGVFVYKSDATVTGWASSSYNEKGATWTPADGWKVG